MTLVENSGSTLQNVLAVHRVQQWSDSDDGPARRCHRKETIPRRPRVKRVVDVGQGVVVSRADFGEPFRFERVDLFPLLSQPRNTVDLRINATSSRAITDRGSLLVYQSKSGIGGSSRSTSAS